MEDNRRLNKKRRVEDQLTDLIKTISDKKKKHLLDLLNEWQKEEKRGDERIPCLISVDYSTKDRVYRDFIQDLSNGGVFIESIDAFSLGQEVAMTFSLPNSQSHFKIAGEVVRNEKKGIGVKFTKKLSQYQEQIIKRSIEKTD